MQHLPTFGIVDPDNSITPIVSKFLLPTEILWQVVTADAAFDALNSKQPELLLTRLNLPDMTGAMFCRWITDNYDLMPIVVVSSKDNLEYVDEIVSMGIRGYLTLQHAETFLESAVEQVMLGGAFYSKDVLSMLVKTLPGDESFRPQSDAYALDSDAYTGLQEHVEHLAALTINAADKWHTLELKHRELAKILQASPV